MEGDEAGTWKECGGVRGEGGGGKGEEEKEEDEMRSLWVGKERSA